MSSWRDGVGQYTWGTYQNTASYLDISVVGGNTGGGSDYYGIPESEMDALRAKNYGTGVHFWRDGNTINITINLIIISVKSDGSIQRRGYYVGDSSIDYKFLANIQYKTKQGNWVELGDKEISTFYGGNPMYDRPGWDTEGSGYLWKTFSFNNIDLSQVSQFSIGIHGEGNTIKKWNYYNIDDIIPTTHKVIIEYRNESNNEEIHPRDSYDVLKGSVYRDTAPYIKGYTPRQKNFSFTVNNNVTYVVWYIRQPKVILNYYIKDTTTPLKQSDSITTQVNSVYTATAPSNINDYVLEGDRVVTLNIRTSDIIYNFYYTRVSYDKPWAIRVSGIWKSFNSRNKEMTSRSGGNFSHRFDQKIRKGSNFVKQRKIGE